MRDYDQGFDRFDYACTKHGNRLLKRETRKLRDELDRVTEDKFRLEHRCKKLLEHVCELQDRIEVLENKMDED